MAVSTDGDQAEGDGVPKPPSKAQVIRDYLEAKPKASNEEVAEALNQAGMKTTASYISDVRSRSKQKKTPKKKSGKKAASSKARAAASANYPRHSIQDALRVPRAILEQNAGKACTTDKAAEFVGVGNHGPFSVELSSATKYGFLERPSSGRVGITDLAKKILRPQQPTDEINGLREAFLNAPDFSDVYKHYRGENLPDAKFFDNALVDNFGIPATKLSEFKSLFTNHLTMLNF